MELDKEKEEKSFTEKEILSVLDGGLILEIVIEETKKQYGIRLINQIKKELGIK